MRIRKTGIPFLIGLIVLLCAFVPDTQAQQMEEDYFKAEQLFNGNNFEKAFQIYSHLFEEQPQRYIFFEKATECLINLKEYEKAIAFSQKAMENSINQNQISVRLGELYHLQGDTTRAFETWKNLKESNRGNLQIYLSLARAMKDRRAFEQSIATYQQAEEITSNSSGIAIELARTYMQAGEYESAIQKYLEMLRESPDQINQVQTVMLQFNDDRMHDIAILEIEDFLNELSLQHPSYYQVHQLKLWLLLERGLYERALSSARNYEESSSRITYTLYSLGSNLLSEQKYELAQQAFSFYLDSDMASAKFRSMQQLAEVNLQWAHYLTDFNLANASKRDSLYTQAFEILEQLQEENPGYQDIDQVLITQAELALDHLQDVQKAEQNLSQLEGRSDSTTIAQRSYIDGRIKLRKQDYNRARIAFTKSNKTQRTGSLVEKTRYYLALTDFFAGDYEFAKIQLNALERQNTSYFANDAVKLRVWIQKGLQVDSTGGAITPFAKAVEHFSKGEQDSALVHLEPMLNATPPHPLTAEALLELNSNSQPELAPLTFKLITRYTNRYGRFSPLRERLMWEKARIADQLVHTNQTFLSSADSAHHIELQHLNEIELPTSTEEIISLYEDILLEFPSGFYATYVRNRIDELQNPQI